MQSHDRAFDGLILQRLQEDINLLVVMIQSHGWNGVMMDSSMLSNDVNANKFSRLSGTRQRASFFTASKSLMLPRLRTLQISPRCALQIHQTQTTGAAEQKASLHGQSLFC
jgi:hypothetical protein